MHLSSSRHRAGVIEDFKMRVTFRFSVFNDEEQSGVFHSDVLQPWSSEHSEAPALWSAEGRRYQSTHRWSWHCGCTWAVSSHRPAPSPGRFLKCPDTGPAACCAARGPWRTRRLSQTGPFPPARTWSRCRSAPDLKQRQRMMTQKIQSRREIKFTVWAPSLVREKMMGLKRLEASSDTSLGNTDPAELKPIVSFVLHHQIWIYLHLKAIWVVLTCFCCFSIELPSWRQLSPQAC